MAKPLDGYMPNFNTLLRAFEEGRVALADCFDTRTNKQVAVIVAMGDAEDGDGFELVPFAIMCEGNPYDYLRPPAADSEGYEPTAAEQEGKVFQ